MKVYLIVEIYSCYFAYPTSKCFANREKAEKYCIERNKEIYRYFQNSYDKYVQPNNFPIFKVKEIEVIEDE